MIPWFRLQPYWIELKVMEVKCHLLLIIVCWVYLKRLFWQSSPTMNQGYWCQPYCLIMNLTHQYCLRFPNRRPYCLRHNIIIRIIRHHHHYHLRMRHFLLCLKIAQPLEGRFSFVVFLIVKFSQCLYFWHSRVSLMLETDHQGCKWW